MSPQQVEFAARIARIEAGGGRRASTIFVGMDESFQYARGGKTRPRAKLGSVLGNIFYPFSLILCVALGVLALGLGRFLQFHLSGLDFSGGDPDIALLIDAGAGLVIALAIGLVDRMRLPDQVISKVLGVAIGLTGFHNLVHLYPQVFELLFSPTWVTSVLSATDTHTLIWRGASFAF